MYMYLDVTVILYWKFSTGNNLKKRPLACFWKYFITLVYYHILNKFKSNSGSNINTRTRRKRRNNYCCI